MKQFPTLAGALMLSACVNEPILLNAINYDVGPPPETANLQLAGISMEANKGLGMTTQQRGAFVKANHGKTVNYYGIIDDIQISGNTARIEIYPGTQGLQRKQCQNPELNRRYGGINCEPQKQHPKTSVTCVVNDWATLNAQTGGQILADHKARKQDFRRWNSIHIEERLAEEQSKTKVVNQQYANYIGPPNSYLDTTRWLYGTIIVSNCNVKGWDHKIM